MRKQSTILLVENNEMQMFSYKNWEVVIEKRLEFLVQCGYFVRESHERNVESI